MRKAYPSDITREQFEVIKHYLESAKKLTHPRNYELYDLFCALLYVLKEGCTWRAIPHDYPDWRDVYKHFRIWKEKQADGTSILDKILKELVISERVIKGRKPKTSMLIADSKSIKNTDTAGEKGYDGGKKNLWNKVASWS
jgi:transposase